MQIVVGVPEITPGVTFGFTVTVFVAGPGALHPVTVYLIVAVPDATPVTIPVDALTVAIPGFRLLHVPPGVPLLV